MVVDPLEPYRQMARSIRFVPPVWQPFHKRLTQSPPIAAPLETSCSSCWTSSPQVDPPIDASANAEALIQAAVSRPTTLPAIYHVAENIGDRISRMGADSTSASQVGIITSATVEPVAPVQSAVSAAVVEFVASIEVESVELIELTEPSQPASSLPEAAAAIVPDRKTSDRETSSKTAQWFGSMADYLEQVNERLESEMPSCPQCGSTNLRKKGTRGNSQRYLCKQCGRNFAQSLSPLAVPDSASHDPASKTVAKRRAVGFGKREKIR